MEVTKDIAGISAQMNKQFMEMSQQIADVAQVTNKAYDMPTSNTLEISKAQKTISEIKTELADLQDC